MYQRSPSRKNRYSPPPGYVGTAFGGGAEIPMEGKVHLPEQNADAGMPAASPPCGPPKMLEAGSPPKSQGLSLTPALGDLLGDLRGKIGTEELILLLVMLLLAADGAGAEVLLLGLLLLAG